MVSKEMEDRDYVFYDLGVGDGYCAGVRDAVEYIRDELGFDLTDSDGLLDMAGGAWNE